MDYDKIGELAERERIDEANALLKRGWMFVKAAETLKLDQSGHQFSAITYILARKRQVKAAEETRNDDDSKSTQKPAALEPDILSLNIDWRQKNGGSPNFYYAFTFGLDGELDPIVSSVVDAIERSSAGHLEQNGWKFTVSKDGKFLQRSRHSTVKVPAVKLPALK